MHTTSSAYAPRHGPAYKVRVASHFLRKWTAASVGERLGVSSITRPSHVCTILTSRCNFNCSFCNHPTMTRVDEMPLQTWKRILLDLKDWLRIYRINFLGGEPLLYPDIFELLGFCRDQGIMAGITTNGSLITDSVARELGGLGLFNISMSVDGATPAVHDPIRSTPGSHDKLMAAVRHLKAHTRGTRLAFRTNIFAENLDDLVPLAHFVHDQGLHSIGYQPIEYRNMDEESEEHYKHSEGVIPDRRVEEFGTTLDTLPENMARHWVQDLDRLDAVIAELKRLKHAGYPILNSTRHLDCSRQYYHTPSLIYRLRQPCKTGWQHMVILPDGLVRSCTELPPYGDLTKQHPRDIWTSAEATHHRQLCARCERTCLNMLHWKRTLFEKAEMFAQFF